MTKKMLTSSNPNNKYVREYIAALERGRNTQHVIPRSDGWAIKKYSAERASRVFRYKTDALKFAKRLAKNQNVPLIIHN